MYNVYVCINESAVVVVVVGKSTNKSNLSCVLLNVTRIMEDVENVSFVMQCNVHNGSRVVRV